MMNSCCDLNFYNDTLEKNEIPPVDSMNYLGMFSQHTYPILNLEKKSILSLEANAAYISGDYQHALKENLERNVMIGCTLKSKFDGIGNRVVPIDVVVALDISGSMSSNLGNSSVNCLELAKNAIMKLFSKLNSEDRFGLLVFDDKSEDILNLTSAHQVKNLKSTLSEIKTSGWTVISTAVEGAIKMMTRNKAEGNRIRRIIFLTDMGDSYNEELLNGIKEASQSGLFITIIGIGYNLDIKLVEKVSKVKGFNYFSATREEHLDMIMGNNFNMNFFPIAYDINLTFVSGDLSISKVYGTNFDNKIHQLANSWKTSNHWLSDLALKCKINFILLFFKRIKKKLPMPALAQCIKFWSFEKQNLNVSEISTCHASEVLFDEKNFPQMKGKFFMVKTVLKNPIPGKICGNFILNYTSILGDKFSHEFPVFLKIDDVGRFNINQTISKGLCLFYYAKFMRKIMRNYENKDGNNNEKALKFLEEENLRRCSDFIKPLFDKLWNRELEEKENLLNNMEKIISNVIENIKNIKENNRNLDLNSDVEDEKSDDINFGRQLS